MLFMDPRFDPGHKSVISHSLWPVFHEYFLPFIIDFLIHFLLSLSLAVCPEAVTSRSVCERLAIPCWAVALIIVGVLVLLGIAALVLLKLLLMFLVG